MKRPPSLRRVGCGVLWASGDATLWFLFRRWVPGSGCYAAVCAAGSGFRHDAVEQKRKVRVLADQNAFPFVFLNAELRNPSKVANGLVGVVRPVFRRSAALDAGLCQVAFVLQGRLSELALGRQAFLERLRRAFVDFPRLVAAREIDQGRQDNGPELRFALGLHALGSFRFGMRNPAPKEKAGPVGLRPAPLGFGRFRIAPDGGRPCCPAFPTSARDSFAVLARGFLASRPASCGMEVVLSRRSVRPLAADSETQATGDGLTFLACKSRRRHD